MTLRERAEKYAETNTFTDSYFTAKTAWLAGFKACAEMAAEACEKNRDRYKEDPACSSCGQHAFMAKRLDSYGMGCRDAHHMDALVIRALVAEAEDK